MNGYSRPTLAIALLALLGTLAAMAAVSVKIPAGTSVQVRITENLSSETANIGQVFHGSLAAPVVANGSIVSQGGQRYRRSSQRAAVGTPQHPRRIAPELADDSNW
jgi:hypothetical protein